MPKQIVPLVTGEIYHVYNRGVDKRDIFVDKFDYLRFYQSLHAFNSVKPVDNFRLGVNREHINKEKLVNIYAYALLSNHFHLIIRQNSEGGLSEFMKRVSVGYTGYFNERYKRTGVLFQGSYKRVHIENDEQLNYLFAYVNENRTVHGLTTEKEVYTTSSWHFQKKFHSKIVNYDIGTYDLHAAQALVKDIYKKRNEMKDLLE